MSQEAPTTPALSDNSLVAEVDKGNDINRQSVQTDAPAAGLNLADFCGTPYSELHSLEVSELDTSKAEEQNAEDLSIEQEAKAIYQSGKALQYMLDYCQRQHLGDDHIIRACLLSFAGGKVLNNELCINLHVGGEAGSGKSHAVSTVLRILPKDKVLAGRFSDRALLYMGAEMSPGTVISADDQALTDVSGEIFKASTSSANDPFIYRTIIDQKVATITLPPRCQRWMVKANCDGSDEQTQDRQLSLFADNSTEHQRQVKELKDRLAASMIKFENSREEKICRKLWDFVESANVIIPFAPRIEVCARERLRNYALFHALIRSSALLAGSRRERIFNEAGDAFLYATEDDFREAARLMNSVLDGTKGSQRHHLTQTESKILTHLKTLPSGEYSFQEIREALKMSASSFTQGVCGRKGNGGLLRIQGIDRIFREGAARTAYVQWNAEAYRATEESKQYFILRPEADTPSASVGFENYEKLRNEKINPSETAPIQEISENQGDLNSHGFENEREMMRTPKKLFNVRGANFD